MRRRDNYFVRTAACLAALALAVSGCAGTEGAESSAAAEEVMESQDVGEAAESQEAEGAAESSDAEETAESRDAEGAVSSPSEENGAEGGTQAQPAQGGYLHPVRSVNHMSSYAQDNRTLLCEGSSPVLSVRDAGYEALNEALALYSSQREAAVTEELTWMEEIAQEHLNTSPEGFYGYSTEVTAELLRADAAVFSFRELLAGYTGGAHGSAGVKGRTYDSQTGKQLALGDVAADLDALYEYLVQEIRAAEYAEGLFEDWEETVHWEVYGETVNGFPYSLAWALGADGMEVYFSPYEIGPWAMGTVTVTVPYGEAGVGEEWRPLTGERNVWPLAAYQDLSMDVDGDGTEETVGFSTGEMRDVEQMYTLSVGEKSVKFNGTYGVTAAYVMENPDGRKYFYADCRTDNDYHYLVIADLAELMEKGTETEIVTYADGMYDDVPMDARSFWLSDRGMLFSTVPVRRLYSAGPDGLPQTEQAEFVVDRFPVTAVQDVPAYTGEGFQEMATVPAGTKLFVTATDEESRVTAETEDGVRYQFEVNGESWPHTIEGKNIEELFEGLVFAG